MSLIFNALQRFARADSVGIDTQEAKPARRNTQSLRRCLLSPGSLLVLAGAICITGLFAVQLVQSLSANARAKNPSISPAAVAQESPPPIAVQTQMDAASSMAAPPAASSDQIMETSPPDDGSSLADSYPDDAKPSSRLTFYPPESKIAAGGEMSQPSGIPTGGNPTAAEPAGGQEHSMPATKPGISDRLAALEVPTAVVLPEERTFPTAAAFSEMNGSDAAPHSAERFSYKEPAEITTIENEGALSESVYRRQAARAAYHLNVAQLSHRIISAMQTRDPALVGRLMKELEKAEGPDSLFLIRLKAYWQIQQNHLEKARGLLEQVLAQKPDDKESGLNLAVVDMRAGQVEPARRRLEQLQRLYPEDNEIAAALRKLQR